MKRAMDVIGATILLAASLPILLILAVGLALSLRAWPVFTQQRIGQHERPFRFVKLRTLPPTAPRYADKYEISELDLPRLARWVRACHLDELPQLFLVLAGRMSLVGPRPEMPELHEQAPRHFAVARTAVRPGCTGLWQIGRDADRLIHEAPRYDLAYVHRQTVLLDAWILWHTLLQIAGLGGPRPLSRVPAWALAEIHDPLEVVHTSRVGQQQRPAA